MRTPIRPERAIPHWCEMLDWHVDEILPKAHHTINGMRVCPSCLQRIFEAMRPTL